MTAPGDDDFGETLRRLAEALPSLSGHGLLSAMLSGELPDAPMWTTMSFTLDRVETGRVHFKGTPNTAVYNPIGSVHGGYFATLLDTAMGCAVHSTLAAGIGYTTLEFKVNLVRSLNADSGEVRATGQILYRGSRIATAEGDIRDAAGRLCAHGSTTCLILPASR